MTEEKKDSKKCSGKKNIMFAYGFIQLGSSFVSAIALAAITPANVKPDSILDLAPSFEVTDVGFD